MNGEVMTKSGEKKIWSKEENIKMRDRGAVFSVVTAAVFGLIIAWTKIDRGQSINDIVTLFSVILAASFLYQAVKRKTLLDIAAAIGVCLVAGYSFYQFLIID